MLHGSGTRVWLVTTASLPLSAFTHLAVWQSIRKTEAIPMAQAYHPQFPHTPIGSLYPTNYVVCVIDNLQEAQQAAQAFNAAGYDASTTRLMESQEALTKIQELESRKNRFQRFFSSFQ